jgi:hypothetical protein
MENPFTDHPHSVGETFIQHFFVATGVGSKMILGGVACFLHGFFPFAFKTTGSRTIRALYERLSHGARHATMQSLNNSTPSQPAPSTQNVAAASASVRAASGHDVVLEYSI